MNEVYKKLSIIIPIYQVEQYVRACLESVFRQGLADDEYELILVNDGTQDRSMEMIADLLAAHANVTVINQENQGLSVARNNGLERATGEYILFLDSDDLLVDGSLYPFLMKTYEMKTDMAIANYVEVPDDEIATLYLAPPKETKWRENTGRAFFTEKQITPMVWDKLYKRSFLKHHHLQFIPGICCEDVPFTYNCYFKANRCLVSDIQLYIYRKRSGSITDQYSQRFAHDTSIAIGEIWKLRQQEGISTEEYNRLEHNCFFYFHKLILSTLKHIPKLSNRLRIMDDLAQNAPDLNFTNGKYQKWITVLYRFSPRLLMILWVLRWKYLKQI